MEYTHTISQIPPDQRTLEHGTLVWVAHRQSTDGPWDYGLWEIYHSDNPTSMHSGLLPRMPSLDALERGYAGKAEVLYFARDQDTIDASIEELRPGGAYVYAVEAPQGLPFSGGSQEADRPAQVLVLRPRPAAPTTHVVVPVYVQYVPKAEGTVRPPPPSAVDYDPVTKAIRGLTTGWTGRLPPPSVRSYSVHVVLCSLLVFAGRDEEPLPFVSAGPLEKIRGPWGERRLWTIGWGRPPLPLRRPLSQSPPPGWREGDLGDRTSADGGMPYHSFVQTVFPGTPGGSPRAQPDDAYWHGRYKPGLPNRPAGVFRGPASSPAWSDDEAGLAIASELPDIRLDRVFGDRRPYRWSDGIRLTGYAPRLSVLPQGKMQAGSYFLGFGASHLFGSGWTYRAHGRRVEGVRQRDWDRYDEITQIEREASYGDREIVLFISRLTRDGQQRNVDLIARTAKKFSWELWPRSVGLRWTEETTARVRVVSYSINGVSVDEARDAWRLRLNYDHLAAGWHFPRPANDPIDVLCSYRSIPTRDLGIPGDSVILHHTSGWAEARRLSDTRTWVSGLSTLWADLAAKLYGGG